MSLPHQSAVRRGFSRADLIIIVLVTGLAVGLLAMAIDRLRNGPFEDQRWLETHNLKQVLFACHQFHDVYMKLPPAFDESWPMRVPASVHVHLLPFLENEPLYNRYRTQGHLDNEKPVIHVYIATLRPGEDEHDVQNFAANLRVFSDKGMNTRVDENMPALAKIEPGKCKFFIKDGNSLTILFSTKHAYCGKGGSRITAAPNSPFAAFFGQNAARVRANAFDPDATFQLAPRRRDCLASPLMAQSFADWRLSVGMADGMVRQVVPNISPQTWNSAMQPNDGNPLGDDW